MFGAGAVTAASFGPILDGIPAALDLFDGHSMLASPRALELAGIVSAVVGLEFERYGLGVAVAAARGTCTRVSP